MFAPTWSRGVRFAYLVLSVGIEYAYLLLQLILAQNRCVADLVQSVLESIEAVLSQSSNQLSHSNILGSPLSVPWRWVTSFRWRLLLVFVGEP